MEWVPTLEKPCRVHDRLQTRGDRILSDSMLYYRQLFLQFHLASERVKSLLAQSN
jgi:hypothetical protein